MLAVLELWTEVWTGHQDFGLLVLPLLALCAGGTASFALSLSLLVRSLTHSCVYWCAHSLPCGLNRMSITRASDGAARDTGAGKHPLSFERGLTHIWGALQPQNSPVILGLPSPLCFVSAPGASLEHPQIPGFDHNNQLGNIWPPGLLGVLGLRQLKD